MLRRSTLNLDPMQAQGNNQSGGTEENRQQGINSDLQHGLSQREAECNSASQQEQVGAGHQRNQNDRGDCPPSQAWDNNEESRAKERQKKTKKLKRRSKILNGATKSKSLDPLSELSQNPRCRNLVPMGKTTNFEPADLNPALGAKSTFDCVFRNDRLAEPSLAKAISFSPALEKTEFQPGDSTEALQNDGLTKTDFQGGPREKLQAARTIQSK